MADASLAKRIEWVDIVKYSCIIMVMMSHLESDTDFLAAIYSPVFLNGFFFVSGYVYKPKDNFKHFLYKKFRQLFVPWFVFSIFDILLSQIFSFNKHDSLLVELKWNFLQIRGANDGVWFLAALFVAFIPFYFFINWYNNPTKSSNKAILAIIMSFGLSLISVIYKYMMPSDVLPWGGYALPWHLEYFFQAMFFMVLGYVFRDKFESTFDSYNKPAVRLIVLAIYLSLVIIPFAVNIEFPIAIDIIYTYFCQIIGIVTIVMLSKIIKSNRYINYVGQNTLIYFALHGKVYSLIQVILKKFVGGIYSFILSNMFLSSLLAIMLSLLLSAILIIPAYIINRWLPFIIGRKNVDSLKPKGKIYG